MMMYAMKIKRISRPFLSGESDLRTTQQCLIKIHGGAVPPNTIVYSYIELFAAHTGLMLMASHEEKREA